jgi:two-component system, NtrC family, sensor kinase
MKALAVGAKDLPWLSPSAATLRTLARSPLSTAWPHLRTDPGLLVLLARVWGRRPVALRKASLDVRMLRTSLLHLQRASDAGAVDWNRPGCRRVYESTLRHAQLAAAVAELVPQCDPDHAWVGGAMASLGWQGACALQPSLAACAWSDERDAADSDGVDTGSLGRRISHAWGLPAWLAAIAGRLSLPIDVAVRLGADPVLFQIAQLAVLLHQRDGGLGLAVGAEMGDLLGALRLNIERVEAIADRVAREPIAEATWEPPASQPLVADLIELALRYRERREAIHAERLHRDIDRLQEALTTRRAETGRQLHALKLAALAEFAAGAGHEINNPLAVISGQAQYLLRQLDRLDGPADEIDNPVEYLINLRSEVAPSLQKIINQTQRIHGILTDLMQFARPAVPHLQAVDVGAMLGDVCREFQALADAHRVRLICEEPAAGVVIDADPGQLRVALIALVRNAIEAAPAGGWAGIRVESDACDRVALVIEDNGPGPGPVAQQHLFDPFFSGRAAGRGRGLGLPIAWRLARQQDGDLRFDGTHDGVTRFRLILRIAGNAPAQAQASVPAQGRNGSAHHGA